MNFSVRGMLVSGLLLFCSCNPVQAVELSSLIDQFKCTMNEWISPEEELDAWHGFFLLFAMYISSQNQK